MIVNEIFSSIDGEVNHWGQGTLSTFIRLAGCNLKCDYCDTEQAQDPEAGEEIPVAEIRRTITKIGCPKITITGGEPLLQKREVRLLVFGLVRKLGCFISIETNGTQGLIDFAPDARKNISWVVDYKLRNQDKMNLETFTGLREQDWIKFVISSPNEYEQAKQVISKLIHFDKLTAKIAFSPVHKNKESVTTLLEKMKADGLWNVKLNLQIHKLVGLK